MATEQKIECPNCKNLVENTAHVIQGTLPHPVWGTIGVVDVGYQCPLCKHIWGHEGLLSNSKEKEEDK